MAQVRANGIDIEVETFGDPADPTILLVMGISFQLVHWPDEFVEQLAGRGFHVVRFDNRDVGLSTWFDDEPRPNPALFMVKSMLGLRPPAPYTLHDMADDTVGVLDALDIDSAHVVGLSMGGMISQRLAIEYPERVRSLCSIMSSTRPPKASFRLILKLLKLGSDPEGREERIENTLALFRLLSGGGFAFDEEHGAGLAAKAVDRAWHPAGTDRQSAAIWVDGDRRAELSGLKIPTTVVHGTADPLILPKLGRETADAVPGAEMVWIEGMGHEWPEEAWPAILDAITDRADLAGR
ncbi:MAG: alpha/beta fold hydrolase [Actinobacteria bacterium]|nr:alpha/beta fold hydrolase [Actinomycetota bacterium]